MNEIINIMTMPFMMTALAAGIVTGFLGSYYGVFVVQRRMSFLGAGLSHAAFGGVALGLLLGIEPLWIAIPFTIIVSVLIMFLRDKTKLGADTSIGILFSVSVAFGIIFLAMKKQFTADAFGYLFGSILSVSSKDLIISLILAFLTILSMFGYWQRWAYATFDVELAESDRLPVERDNYILSILIASSIVISIKLVGIMLIAAYLVIPAASARLISKTFFVMTVYSVIIGILSSIIGLVISIIADIPSGAAIILIQALFFIISIVIKKFFN
jgi:zinc transport system permease protein